MYVCVSSAQSLGLPLLQPYLGMGRRRISIQDFEKGLNFAVAGATALDEAVLREKGITNLPTNYSLGVQLEWFKNTYSFVCKSSSTATESRFPSFIAAVPLTIESKLANIILIYRVQSDPQKLANCGGRNRRQ